jgi:hypothetical protein
MKTRRTALLCDEQAQMIGRRNVDRTPTLICANCGSPDAAFRFPSLCTDCYYADQQRQHDRDARLGRSTD